LKDGTIGKKCEILCKKIRTLTQNNEYQRIIFCSDLKTVKKFKRSKNKNKSTLRVTRIKKIRTQAKGTLTAASLGQVNKQTEDKSVTSKSKE
jgi:lysozyme family protein